MRVHILTDQIGGAGYGGGRGLGRGRLIEGCRNKVERCPVRELALQVYKTICNNIFKLGNLLQSTREVVE